MAWSEAECLTAEPVWESFGDFSQISKRGPKRTAYAVLSGPSYEVSEAFLFRTLVKNECIQVDWLKNRHILENNYARRATTSP